MDGMEHIKFVCTTFDTCHVCVWVVVFSLAVLFTSVVLGCDPGAV
jgi:hypothetical protein